MNNSNIGKRDLPKDMYFAAVPKEDLAEVLMAKAMKFRERLDREGRIDVWKRSERTYYGHDGEGGLKNSVAVTFTGDEDENATVRVNHYRSIIQAIIAMVTGARPSFKARAINTDVGSLSKTGLAEGVVGWVYRDKDIEGLRVEQTERAVVSGEGYLHLRWDVHAGRKALEQERPVYDERGEPVIDEQQVEAPPEPGMPQMGMQQPPRMMTQQVPRMERYPVREGDIAPDVLGPLEVVRDLDARVNKWVMVPHRENVWDLIARYPALRNHILAQRGQERWPRRVWSDGAFETPTDDDDAVCVWCFYHLPTDALPQGRYVLFCGDVVLVDESWNFGDEVPVYGLLPMREMGTGSGHSPIWDLLCLQELYDACVTSLWNACEGTGEGNILAPKGSDVDVTMLARARQLIEYDVVEGAPEGGRPSSLELFRVAQDTYKIEELLKRTMETLSGINSVTRGEPSSNLKSGAALALVQSLSTHFNSALQGCVTRNDEAVGTGILKLYQRFSPLPRLAEITGKKNTTALKQFTGEDLEAIQRVTVEIGNAATSSREGALDIGMQLVQAGVITKPEMLFEVLETGRIEPLFDDIRDPLTQIRDENEKLAAGQQVEVSMFDNDVDHIRHHRLVFADPDSRTNGALIEASHSHLEQHMAALDTKDIKVMWAIGQEIPPWRQAEAAMMGAAPGGPMPGAEPPSADGPSAPGGPPPGEGSPVERAKPMGKPGGADMPLMPMIAGTDERAPAGPPM